MSKRLLMAGILVMVMSVSVFAYGLKPVDGSAVVTTAGTAVQLSATSAGYFSLVVCAKEQNTGVIVIGASDVVAAQATRKGIPLNAGDCRSYSGPNVGNRADLYEGDISRHYIDATVNGEGVTYEYITGN